jgi:hydroxymethylpyrimidine pyrophosphatase-like HAD family hydrolase
MLRIAIDFDGTIVEHVYPLIGEEKVFAFQTMKELQKRGYRLILWTFRSGKELDEAVEYCRNKGIEFYAVNKNYPEEVFDETISRKIDADIYIDDKNIGGFKDWSWVWEQLDPDHYYAQSNQSERSIPRKTGFFNRIQGKKKNQTP